MSCLRLSSDPIASDLIPSGKVDLVISLEPMEALRYVHLLAPGGRVITSTDPFVNITNYPELEAVLSELTAVPGTVTIAAEAIAKEVASPRSSNMALLGAAAPYIGLPAEVLEESIRTIFMAKGEKIVENNLAAFRAGMEQGK